MLARYKQDFVAAVWENEKYKWVAVKLFQENWDIDAEDFSGMLDRALSKTYNLLAPMNNLSKGMIFNSAKAAPEGVRAMFMALFDEGRDYWERINEFKQRSIDLLKKLAQDGQSYQIENAITTYLWLRYSERYYNYKSGEIRKQLDGIAERYFWQTIHA